MSEESITKEDTENLLYIARQIHLDELAFGDEHEFLRESISSKSSQSLPEDVEDTPSNIEFVHKYSKGIDQSIFTNPDIIAKTRPFQLKWTFGVNSVVKIRNLTTAYKNQIFFASSHFPILYNYCKKEMIHLEGHTSKIRSVSCDMDGDWLATAESSPEGCLIVWKACHSQITPVRTFYEMYPLSGVLMAEMSKSARFIITVGAGNSLEYSIDLWLWTLGKDLPDHSKRVTKEFGRPKAIVNNKSIDEHVMIVFEKRVVFIEVNVAEGKIAQITAPPIMMLNKTGILNGATYIKKCHECFVSSAKGCILIFGNTLYPKPYEEGKLDNAKIFRNAVKISSVSVNAITSTGDFVVTGDAHGAILFFDKKIRILYWITDRNIGAIASISFNVCNKFIHEDDKKYIIPKAYDFRIFNCDYSDIVDDLQAIFKKDLPTDASLIKNHLMIKDFFVCTVDCNIYAIDCINDKCTSLFYVAEDSISSMAIHDEKNYIVMGYVNGRIMILDYEDNIEVASTFLPTSEEQTIAITCIQYSVESVHLVCGTSNGEIWILDPILLTPKCEEPFTITKESVMKIQFSHQPLQFAYYDSNRTVVLFSYETETSEWIFRGKIRAHYNDIQDIMFMPGNPSTRLYTISKDRHLIEYNNYKVPKEEFDIEARERIEQTSIPISFTYWIQTIGESRFDYILLADNKQKLKLLYQSSKIPKTVALGPAFGCFKSQLINKMTIIPGCASKYMVFSTGKHLGICILPPDGNPYKFVGYLAHPNGIKDFQVSYDGKYVFSFGKRDHALLKWEIKTQSVEMMSVLGGKELSPFYSLLEGGRNGWLFHEIKDLFYYMQILHQENIDLPRRVTDTLSLADIPDLVRTCGFYPTEFQLENMLIDIRYRNFDDSLKVNEDINFTDFVRLFINHRPAYGYSLEQLKQAFDVLRHSAEDYHPGGLTREELLNIFTTQGEPLTPYNTIKCLKVLMRQYESGTIDENIDFLPEVISFDTFCDDILGIDMAREKIRDDNESEYSTSTTEDDRLKAR